MAMYERDSWVWVSDAEDFFIPAKVKESFHAGEASTVLTEDGEDRVLTAEQTKALTALNEEALNSGIDNLINFNDLNENALLHNLRIRFKRDKIYTYVSSILISVNPFKQLPLYTPEVLESYRQSGRDKPPHIFAVANNAYASMLSERKNQSVIISGESGAGKSEATKLILQYIAETSAHKGGNGDGGSRSLEQQILQSNPLMEAFGNAKTVRNNNSSRFGKLITVYFDQVGSIAGGSVISYLLEKSRVVYQMENERNYHIFYQLIRGVEAHPELKSILHLDSPSAFAYTNQSGVDHIEGVSDETDFEEVKEAMGTLGISSGDQVEIFKTVAAVLHFGNVKFEIEVKVNGDDGSRVSNPPQLALAAGLVGLDCELITRALTWRNIGTRSVTMVAYSLTQAQQARDAMSKAVYSALFDWLMKKINRALGGGGGNGIPQATSGETIIGVLDIFGFESFESNSFEQLCINFCNEKLQFHFNEHIFRLEQEVYASEGVIVPATAFKDNRPTLLLLEDKANGLFSMIDEEGTVPKGSDESYLSKVKTKHGKHENIALPKPSQKIKDSAKCFGVKHYAGEVFYNVTNFIEKNRDTLHNDILSALQLSTSPFMQDLFPKVKEEPSGPASILAAKGGAPSRVRSPPPTGAGGGTASTGSAKKLTLGTQFKAQLNNLMDTLNSTFPHFVRCMKPNSLKKGSIFQSQMMLAQLRYAGLLEVCRIRKLGYPVRRDFDDFIKRYRCIAPGVARLEPLTAQLMAKGALKQGLWAQGKTKVFLKNEQSARLELKREEALSTVVSMIQKHVRRWQVKQRFRNWSKILVHLRSAVATRSMDQLEQWIDMAAELPYHGQYIKEVRAARALRQRLLEEHRVTALLEGAIKAREVAGLRAALAAAESMVPSLVGPTVEEGRCLVARLEEEVQVRSLLQATIKKRDKVQLFGTLRRAQALALDCDETRQASMLLARLEDEEGVTINLCSAINDRNLSLLSTWLSKALEIGLEVPEVAKGQAMQKVLEAEALAKMGVTNAIRNRDLTALTAAVEKATQVGLASSEAEVVEGKRLLYLLQQEASAMHALKAAVESRQLARLQAAVNVAEGLKQLTCLSEYNAAVAVLEQLLAEEKCRKDLTVAAKASNDSHQLTQALAEAVRLGLTGSDVDAARAVSQKLGSQSNIRIKLNTLLTSESLMAVNAVLKEALSQGLDATPEAISLQERKKVLEHEEGLIQDLRASLASQDLEDLHRAIAAMTASSPVALKYASELSSAKDLHTKLAEGAKLSNELHAAIRSRSHDNLDDVLKRIQSSSTPGLIPAHELAEGAIVLAELQKEKALLTEMAAATKTKNFAKLEAIVEKANDSNIAPEKLQPARVLLDRSKNTHRASEALVTAVLAKNLKDLQESIEVAIQLGLEGPEVVAANTMHDELIRLEGVKQDLMAAVNTLRSKGKSEAGIQEADIAPLSQSLRRATAAGGLQQTDAQVWEAMELQAKMMKQLEIQASLRAALRSKKENEIKRAVDQAEDEGLLFLNDLNQAKTILKSASQTVEPGNEAGLLVPTEEFDADELERQREARRNRARNPKFHFRNYSGLRSPDDYAKGVLLNKKKVKEEMLHWQNAGIIRSLTELDSSFNKVAIQLHKCLLGYMGDKQMSFPATLAQEILRKGHHTPEIRDEIYLQVLKQLASNKKAESLAKGWQMLCMCVTTFPPSPAFQDYLLNYILEREGGKGAIRNYARYCLKTLEGIMVDGGPSGFVPSIEEISAYKERPPILATIESVDGTVVCEELPISPDLDVGKVVGICVHFLGMKEGTATTGTAIASQASHNKASSSTTGNSRAGLNDFGIFVYDLPGESEYLVPKAAEDGGVPPPAYHDLPRTPRPLSFEDYMGTVLVEKVRQRRNFKFVFKRKIFLPPEMVADPLDDPMYSHLTYLQLEDEVIITGNLCISKEDDALTLSALALLINFGDDYATVDHYMNFIPPSWRIRYPDEMWKEKLIARIQLPIVSSSCAGSRSGSIQLPTTSSSAARSSSIQLPTTSLSKKKVMDQTLEELKHAFIDLMTKHEYYGSHFFYTYKQSSTPEVVARLPRDLVLAFNAHGLHLFDRASWRHLSTYPFADIYKWGGSSSQFSLVLWNPEMQTTFDLTVVTAQAVDIATIILDYIHAIMATLQATADDAGDAAAASLNLRA